MITTPPHPLRFVEELMDAYENLIFAKWVKKFKNGKTQQRLLVVTDQHVYSVKSGVVGLSVSIRRAVRAPTAR